MKTDIEKQIFILKRQAWWALNDDNIEEFNRIMKEIDEMEEKKESKDE